MVAELSMRHYDTSGNQTLSSFSSQLNLPAILKSWWTAQKGAPSPLVNICATDNYEAAVVFAGR